MKKEGQRGEKKGGCLHLNDAAVEVLALGVVELGAILRVLIRVAELLELLEGEAAVYERKMRLKGGVARKVGEGK